MAAIGFDNKDITGKYIVLAGYNIRDGIGDAIHLITFLNYFKNSDFCKTYNIKLYGLFINEHMDKLATIQQNIKDNDLYDNDILTIEIVTDKYLKTVDAPKTVKQNDGTKITITELLKYDNSPLNEPITKLPAYNDILCIICISTTNKVLDYVNSQTPIFKDIMKENRLRGYDEIHGELGKYNKGRLYISCMGFGSAMAGLPVQLNKINKRVALNSIIESESELSKQIHTICNKYGISYSSNNIEQILDNIAIIHIYDQEEDADNICVYLHTYIKIIIQSQIHAKKKAFIFIGRKFIFNNYKDAILARINSEIEYFKQYCSNGEIIPENKSVSDIYENKINTLLNMYENIKSMYNTLDNDQSNQEIISKINKLENDIGAYVKSEFPAFTCHRYTKMRNPICKTNLAHCGLEPLKNNRNHIIKSELPDNVHFIEQFLLKPEFNNVLQVNSYIRICSGDNTIIESINYGLFPLIMDRHKKYIYYNLYKYLNNPKRTQKIDCSLFNKFVELTHNPNSVIESNPLDPKLYDYCPLGNIVVDQYSNNNNIQPRSVITKLANVFTPEFFAEWKNIVDYIAKNCNTFNYVEQFINESIDKYKMAPIQGGINNKWIRFILGL